MIGICRDSCDLRFVLPMMCLNELVIRNCYGPGQGGYPTMVVETRGAVSRSQFDQQHMRHEYCLFRLLQID